MSEPTATTAEVPAPKESVPVVPRVPVRMLDNGRVTVYHVPVDEEFLECRRSVAETRAEEAQEREKQRTDADRLLEASAEPFAEAIGAAVEDCEQKIAQMREVAAGDDDSGLFRIASLIGAHYSDWCAKQPDQDLIVVNDAPIYIARLARTYEADAKTLAPWGTPHIIDLKANNMQKIFSEADLKVLIGFKMYKRAPRALLLERPLPTPDGVIVMSFVFIFGIRGELRAELATRANKASPSPAESIAGLPPQEDDRDIVPLRSFLNCTKAFNPAGYKTKTNSEKAAALQHSRLESGRQLYQLRRLAKREDRFAAMFPALISAIIGAMSVELATFYDPEGVVVPREAIIIEVQCHDNTIVFDECCVVTHTHIRATLAQLQLQLQEVDRQLKTLKPLKDKTVPSAADIRLRADFLRLMGECKKLQEINQLAFVVNTRNEIVFSLNETGTGLDAESALSSSFVRRTDIPLLLKRVKLTAQKGAATAAANAQAPSAVLETTVDAQAPLAAPEPAVDTQAPIAVLEPVVDTQASVAVPTNGSE